MDKQKRIRHKKTNESRLNIVDGDKKEARRLATKDYYERVGKFNQSKWYLSRKYSIPYENLKSILTFEDLKEYVDNEVKRRILETPHILFNELSNKQIKYFPRNKSIQEQKSQNK